MNETMTYADAFTRAFAREPEFLTFLQTKAPARSPVRLQTGVLMGVVLPVSPCRRRR